MLTGHSLGCLLILDDAITVANSTAYGLTSGVVTRSLDNAIACVKRSKTGTVNISEVPGYRTRQLWLPARPARCREHMSAAPRRQREMSP